MTKANRSRKIPSEPSVDYLVESIEALATELRVPAATISRDTYRRLRTCPKQLMKLWSDARLVLREKAFESGELQAFPYLASKQQSLPIIEDSGKKGPTPLIPAYHTLKGVSTLIGSDGVIKTQWVKTRANEIEPDELIEIFKKGLTEVPSKQLIPSPDESPDLLAVYPLGDPHVGMLAWARETGASFDLEIAVRDLADAMANLVLRGPKTRKALIVNLGDFFHADNWDQRTTSNSHPLDVDGRTARILEMGVGVFTKLVDTALQHHEQVEVDCVAGNHDRYTSLCLALVLQAHYRDNPRVLVPIDPHPRHYHTFGQVLIGTTHGDRAKPTDLPGLMAAEKPQAWGSTIHRHWLTGHVHHQSVKEFTGCTVETFRTLAARDSWHTYQGYLSKRDMKRLVFHPTFGEVSRETCSLEFLAASR